MTNRYSVCRLDQAPDAFGGRYRGEMKILAGPLDTEPIALT